MSHASSRLRRTTRVVALAASSALLACGSTPSAEPQCGTAPCAADSGMAKTVACPVQEPTENAPCPALNLVCSLGTSPRPECRDLWECTAGGWDERRHGCADLTSFCPPEQPDGSACAGIADPNDAGYCAYGGVLCLCACGEDAGPCPWVCHIPPTTAGCPPLVPNLGTPCSVQGTQCSYGDPCDGYGTDLYCRAATWQPGFIGCPI
jgi:hypothetical protein